MSAEPSLPLGYLAVLAGRAVEGATAPAAAQLGISRAEMNLMYEIAAHAPVTAASLSRVLGVRPSAVTPLTSSLLAAGLVCQVPGGHDRRQRWWGLTPAGQGYLRQAYAYVAPDVEAVFSHLDPDERAQLAELLNKAVEPWLVSRVPPRAQEAS